MPSKKFKTKTEQIEEIIKNFGKGHSKIERIGFASFPEDGKGYVFIALGIYSRKLENEVTNLSARIMQKYNENLMLIVWPSLDYRLDRVIYEKRR